MKRIRVIPHDPAQENNFKHVNVIDIGDGGRPDILSNQQVIVARRGSVWCLIERDLIRRQSRISVQWYPNKKSARSAWAAGVPLLWRQWTNDEESCTNFQTTGD